MASTYFVERVNQLPEHCSMWSMRNIKCFPFLLFVRLPKLVGHQSEKDNVHMLPVRCPMQWSQTVLVLSPRIHAMLKKDR